MDKIFIPNNNLKTIKSGLESVGGNRAFSDTHRHHLSPAGFLIVAHEFDGPYK